MNRPDDGESSIVNGQLKFECIIMEPVATRFVLEADEEDRAFSANGRHCIKKYYEWMPQIARLRQLEKDYLALQTEVTRLRQYVAGAPAPALPGPDYRPTTSKSDLRESAG